MTDEPGTFSPIGNSDARMHGATSLLVSGYTIADQASLRKMLNASELGHVPVVFVAEACSNMTLAQLANLPDRHGEGTPSALRRGIVMSGLTETELHRLMAVYRTSGMAQQHWASVTPTSDVWPLAHLLAELSREQQALKEAMTKNRQA